MISISHWGMFDARSIPYEFWPLRWANDVDTEFDGTESCGFIVPAGFRIVEGQDVAAALSYPGAFIEIERIH
jgi:hypothetical protein